MASNLKVFFDMIQAAVRDMTIGGQAAGRDMTIGGQAAGSDMTIGGQAAGRDLTIGVQLAGGDMTIGRLPAGRDMTIGGQPAGRMSDLGFAKVVEAVKALADVVTVLEGAGWRTCSIPIFIISVIMIIKAAGSEKF